MQWTNRRIQGRLRMSAFIMQSFRAESAHRIDGGGASGRDDGRDKGANCEGTHRKRQRKWIPIDDSVELRRHEATGADGQRYTEHQSENDFLKRAPEDKLDDVGPVGAKRHADTDLARALGDRVSGDAVEADSGENQSDDTEQAGQAGNRPSLTKPQCDLLLHGADITDREIWIRFGKRLFNQRLDSAGIHPRYKQDVVD